MNSKLSLSAPLIEQAVIGAALAGKCEPAAIKGMAGCCTVDAHNAILEHMGYVAEAHGHIDPISLAAAITEAGHGQLLDEFGGLNKYLAELACNAPSTANAKLYLELFERQRVLELLIADMQALAAYPSSKNWESTKQAVAAAFWGRDDQCDVGLLLDRYVASTQCQANSVFSTGNAELDELLGGGVITGNVSLVVEDNSQPSVLGGLLASAAHNKICSAIFSLHPGKAVEKLIRSVCSKARDGSASANYMDIHESSRAIKSWPLTIKHISDMGLETEICLDSLHSQNVQPQLIIIHGFERNNLPIKQLELCAAKHHVAIVVLFEIEGQEKGMSRILTLTVGDMDQPINKKTEILQCH